MLVVYRVGYLKRKSINDSTHCVPDVVWGHWKYKGSDICHFIGLDAHKLKCYVENSKKKIFGANWG